MPRRSALTTPQISFLVVAAAALATVALWPRSPNSPLKDLPTLPGVTATLERAEDSTGDLIVVRQTIRNDTERRLVVYRAGGGRFEVADVVVHGPSGWKAWKVHDRPWYSRLLRPPRSPGIQAGYLEPGEEKSYGFPVGRLYEMWDPGKYTVEIAMRYRLDDEPQHYRTDAPPLTVAVSDRTGR